MQTFIVHNRQPLRLLAELGGWRWLGFQVQFGGIIAASLIYPASLALLLWLSFAGTGVLLAETHTDQLLKTVALFNLFAGLGVAVMQALVGAIGARRWKLLLDVPLMPVYWLLISVAAYRALWQLGRQPFNWEKTEHGLGRSARTLSRRRR